MMFAILFAAIVFELLASMGTFGALVAQNLFTNSAAGWYIRLDWTAVYAYVVSMMSVIASFFLAIGALTRGAPAGRRHCSLLFNPFAIFVLAFVFSVLWVVIAGFAYRNPLPMKYPCDIFRHLRNSLQMLGIMSGKSLIEEGGLLVGICQSSKAFLVLTGLGLGFWILILVSSCAAMAVGLGPSKKGATRKDTGSSIRTALSRLHRRGQDAQQLPPPAIYAAAGPLPIQHPAPVPQPPAAVHNPAAPAVSQPRQTAASRPHASHSACQCSAHCPYRKHDTQRAPMAGPSGQAANLHSAFGADGYSRDISPRPAPPADSRPAPPASQPERRIDDNDDDAHSGTDEHNRPYGDEADDQYNESYILGGGGDACCGMHGHHCHQHHEVQHHSPMSQGSRRQRLRNMFTRESDQHV
ncbi:hypothetical protein H4R19_001543 [Coemansia spiralis]|nr:hypothetical protein H4R19_001543 [Coemansia spiralis]